MTRIEELQKAKTNYCMAFTKCYGCPASIEQNSNHICKFDTLQSR